MSLMDQPRDVGGVLRDLVDAWWRERRAPTTIRLENVHGEWEEPTESFLAGAVEHGWYGEDVLPRATRESVESITGREVGSYRRAAAALLETFTPGDA